MFNESTPTEFLLLGFSDIWGFQLLAFGVFFIMYTLALIANLLVFIVIASGHHLHKPMYFFLMNISIIDIASISNIIPKAMANSLLNTRVISYYACAAQVFFLFFLLASEVFVLTIMAYDRYMAICDPLNYARVMNRRFCFQLAASAWIGGLFYGTVHSSCTFLITFCSNVINQFFCEVPHLLILSCSDLYLVEIWALALAAAVSAGCFALIVVSYIHIFRTVLGMTSLTSKRKTFSTCIPHLMVVSLFFIVGIFAYVKPVSSSPSKWDLAISFMYTVITPTMNPIIYTIRNREIKAELCRLFSFTIGEQLQFCDRIIERNTVVAKMVDTF